MALALEFVEYTLLQYQGEAQDQVAEGLRRTQSMSGSAMLDGDKALMARSPDEQVENNSLLESRQAIMEATGFKINHPMMGLLVELHGTLNKYCAGDITYSPAMLKKLVDYLTVKTYSSNATIYSFSATQGEEKNSGEISAKLMSGSFGETTPPAIWLLRGEVVHHWTGNDHKFGHAQKIAASYKISNHGMLEKASISEQYHGLCCLGLFQTTTGFLGMMPHMGAIVATHESTCVQMSSKQFHQLLTNEAEVAQIMLIYLARKQFMSLGNHRTESGPKPML
jgi:hypothetical protein